LAGSLDARVNRHRTGVDQTGSRRASRRTG
jgi:hypothetical protein